jgi:hypothetical protein
MSRESPPPPTPAPRRLSFYRRLSPALRREYDRSDALRRVPLEPSAGLAGAANALVVAIEAGARPAVAKAANALVATLCLALERAHRKRVPPPLVKVLRVRPRASGGEFHGLYTRTEDGKVEIKVWMFTAAERRVVRPRTFLRTLLHEVVHHLDFVLFDLPNSLHTLGFHARESSLLDAIERSGATVPGGRQQRPLKASSAKPVKRGQLGLFD